MDCKASAKKWATAWEPGTEGGDKAEDKVKSVVFEKWNKLRSNYRVSGQVFVFGDINQCSFIICLELDACAFFHPC